MNKIFKLFALTAIAISTFTSCSDDASNYYTWMVESQILKQNGNPQDLEFFTNWTLKHFDEIKPFTHGEAKNLSNSEVETLKTVAEGALKGYIEELEKAQNNVDFGTAEVTTNYNFIIKSSKNNYISDNFVLQRKNTDVGLRIYTKEAISTNVTTMLGLSEKFNSDKTLTCAEFGMDSGTKIDVDADRAVAYNSSTREKYTGNRFFQLASDSNGNLYLKLTFMKEFLNDYLGNWYILVPGRATTSEMGTTDFMYVILINNK